MQVRITINNNGTVEAEYVSILEDLHHDYLYFKGRAERYNRGAKGTQGWFQVKRYQRAALLALMSYLEGVVNHWLQGLLSKRAWKGMNGKSLHEKCNRLVLEVTQRPSSQLRVKNAKDLRNDIVHLKAGSDLRIYDEVSLALLTQTEAAIDRWLSGLEPMIGRPRHPSTKKESDSIGVALGNILHEGGSEC
jgi:hypothetical protein